MINTTIGGAIAAPRRLALCVIPWTKPRSSRGYQSCMAQVAPGNAPAAPPKKKAKDQKGHCARGCRSGRGHNGPVGDNDRQNPPWPEPIAKPTAGDLKHGIGPDEGAEDCAHSDL